MAGEPKPSTRIITSMTPEKAAEWAVQRRLDMQDAEQLPPEDISYMHEVGVGAGPQGGDNTSDPLSEKITGWRARAVAEAVVTAAAKNTL